MTTPVGALYCHEVLPPQTPIVPCGSLPTAVATSAAQVGRLWQQCCHSQSESLYVNQVGKKANTAWTVSNGIVLKTPRSNWEEPLIDGALRFFLPAEELLPVRTISATIEGKASQLFTAKPFVPNMITWHEALMSYRLENIVSNLNPYAMTKAILGLTLQLYDLHGDNVGLTQDQQGWRLTLFDTDHCMAETNGIHFGVRTKFAADGFVPIHSTFFGHPWARQPLDQHALASLLKREPEEELLAWLMRSESPIYMRMAPPVRKAAQEYIKSLLLSSSDLSLSIEAINTRTVPQTMEQIKNRFVALLSKPNLWNNIFWHQVYIAAPHTLNQPRRQLAGQFFPRVTGFQIQALEERLARKDRYLAFYVGLSLEVLRFAPDRQQCLEDLALIAAMRDCPLSHFARSKLRAPEVAQLSTSELQELYVTTLRATMPSYTNLARVMYPLLNDVIEVAERLPHLCHVDGTSIDRIIGTPNYPLSWLRNKALKYLPHLPPAKAEELSVCIAHLDDSIAQADAHSRLGRSLRPRFLFS